MEKYHNRNEIPFMSGFIYMENWMTEIPVHCKCILRLMN